MPIFNTPKEFLSYAFSLLDKGDYSDFFEFLDDNIIWGLEVFHPATGKITTLTGIDQVKDIFDHFNRNAAKPVKFTTKKIATILEEKNTFIVLINAFSLSKKNNPYENHQCWIVTIKENPYKIVKIVDFLDSQAVTNFYKDAGE